MIIATLLRMLTCGLSTFALAPLQNGGALLGDPDAVVGGDFALRRAEVQASADPSGHRKPNQQHESVNTATVRAAYRFALPWQAGVEFQLADRARDGARSTAPSELNFDLGRRDGSVLSYAQVTAPVSRSAYEQDNQYQLDALGRGFWAFGIGQVWTFARGDTALNLTYEVHRSLARDFANAGNAGTLRPGFGANWAVGLSQKMDWFTAGLTIAESYEDPVAVRGDRKRHGGSAQRMFTPTVSAAAALGGGWTLAVTYNDQTILPAATADLTREAGVVINKIW